MNMSLRRFVSIFSLVLVVLLVVVSWGDIRQAWDLLGKVDLWILSLIVPAQLISYYASGAAITSFLKAKGNLKDVRPTETIRFALEFNFVNHILPTAGLSGLSYAAWRFKKLGVSASRTALANVLRAALVFLVFLVFLLISVYMLALNGDVNRLLLVTASSLSTLIVVGVLLTMYALNSRQRSRAAGRQVARFINLVGRKILRRKQLLTQAKAEDFFLEMNEDYKQLREEPRQLRAPLVWAIVFVIMEIVIYFIVFASLGYLVSPAALVVAYGVGIAAGIIASTPGGAGAFEAGMVAVLAGAAVPQGIAIAGVILGRVILVFMALVSGYVFYQLTLNKYGRIQKQSEQSNQ